MAEPLLDNVSDTARWVAAYRARESLRTDALFKDPLAARLAGDKGRALAGAARTAMSPDGWPIVARTRIIDDLIAKSLAEGCDLVVNLAAGLDTRPYRLELPSTLRWIEADLPAIIDEKERLLANETPRCQLARERVDLADAAAREATLARALTGAVRALVITEGLLVYLEAAQVTALARTLARPEVRWWMIDVASPALRDMMMRRMRAHLDNAPMKFAPADGVAFFEHAGWKPREIQSVFQAAKQFRRLPLILRVMSILPFPDPDPRKPGRSLWSAVVRLERA